MLFNVKITTQHPDKGCKQVSKVNVVAGDWAQAATRAIELIKPDGPHRMSVKKAGVQ